MRYGYARVSSKGQATDGTSLDTQTQQLKDYGCTEIVAEAYTGTKAHRPKLDQLTQKLQAGDELVVTKLDRIARSLTAGLELFEQMDNKGVRVTVLNMGTMSGDPASRLMRNVMLAVAEFERDMIYERTREGLERAHEQGKHEGRPPKTTTEELALYKELVDNDELTVTQAAQELGISRACWYASIKRMDSKAA